MIQAGPVGPAGAVAGWSVAAASPGLASVSAGGWSDGFNGAYQVDASSMCWHSRLVMCSSWCGDQLGLIGLSFGASGSLVVATPPRGASGLTGGAGIRAPTNV